MFSSWFDPDGLFAELEALRRQLMDMGSPPWGATTPTARPMLEQKDDGYVLRMDLPGVKPEELEIECSGSRLHIRAERRVEAPKGARAVHQERRGWRIDRSLNLPEHIDPDKVSAELKNGVLVLELPARTQAARRRISVSST